jgi:hypothetical protein
MRVTEVFDHHVYSSSLDLVSLLTFLYWLSLSGDMSVIGHCPRLSVRTENNIRINRLLYSSRLFAQLRLVFLSIEGASSVCSSSIDGVHGGGSGAPASGAMRPWQWAASSRSWSASPSLSCCCHRSALFAQLQKASKAWRSYSTGTGLIEYIPYMYFRVYVSI